MKIGAITIGQSPRADVTPEFLAAFGAVAGAAACAGERSGVELVQRGVLDGLCAQEIADMAPRQGEGVLVSRLRDGSEVLLSEERVHERMRECVRDLERGGVELIALFCTGEFPDLESRLPLLRPDRLLAHFVSAIAPADRAADRAIGGSAGKAAYRICAVVPSALQSDAMREKWSRHGFDAEIVALSPYSSRREDWERAAQKAQAADCDLVILDCIGYSGAIRAVFRRVCGKPIILPRTLLGRAAAELAGQ